jgi:hypothetical protein
LALAEVSAGRFVTKKLAATAPMFLFAILLLFAGQITFAQSWYDAAWSSRQKITIDSNHADFSLGGNLTDFPILIKITDSTNPLFGKAQSDGDDILFTTSDGTTKIPHEIEYYDDSTGNEEMDAWAKVPTLLSSADTVIYMYYGNSSAGSQESAENVWDSDYQGVWHLNETATDEGTTGIHYDSTSNSYDGSQHGNSSSTIAQGKIAIAQYFDGADDAVDDLINVDNVPTDDWTGVTVEAWFWAEDWTATDDQKILCKSATDATDDMVFSLQLNENAVGEMKSRVGTDLNPLSSSQNLGPSPAANGTWYYAAFKWTAETGAADNWFNYVDGNLDAAKNKAGNALVAATVVENVVIGATKYPALAVDQGTFWGYLDEIRLSNVARSGDWIKANYVNQKYDNSPANNYLTFQEELFISGSVYIDEGINPIGPNKTVALSVNGGITSGTDLFSDETDANGSYEIFIPEANLSAGDEFIVFLDDETENGASVTVSDGNNLSGLDIYQSHVIVRHDNSGTMTNALMGLADNGDADIDYSVSGGALTVGDLNDVSLYVPTGHTFQPGGNVTVGDADTASDVKVRGAFDSSNAFNVFGNISGTGSLNGGTATIDVNGSLEISTYSATTGTTSVGGDWDISVFAHNSGAVVFDGTGTVTGGTFYSLQINASGFTRTANGNLTVENGFTLTAGTFVPGSGDHSISGNWDDTGVTFAPTAGTISLTSTNPTVNQAAANNFYHLFLLDGGSLSSGIDVDGDITINSGTFNTNSFNITVGRNWSNFGTFTAGTGEVRFDDGTTTSIITGETTFNDFVAAIAGSGKILMFEAGKRQTINGWLEIGDATLRSTVSGTQWEIDDSGASDVGWTTIKDSNAITPRTCVDGVDDGNNTNWTFSVVWDPNYWQGDVDTNWNNANNWSKGVVPSNDTDTANVPQSAQRMPVLTQNVTGSNTPYDIVIQSGATLDTAGYDIAISDFWNFGTIRRKAGDTVNFDDTGTTVYYGEITSASDIEDYGAGDDYYNLVFEGAGITFTGGFSLTVASDLTVASGTLDMESNNLTVGDDITINAAGELKAGSGNLTVGGDVSGLGAFDGQTALIDIDGSILVDSYSATTGTTTVAGDWDVDAYAHNSGTVAFDGSGTADPASFYDLNITSGTRTAAAALNVANNLAISSGATLSLGTGNLTVDGNVSGAGTLEGGTATVDVNGDLGTSGVPLGNYTATSEKTYVGGNWNISGAFIPGTGTVVFNNAGTLGVYEAFYDLTIEAGASLDTQANSIWISGAFENQGTLYREGGDYVSKIDSDSGTVVYRTAAGNIQSYTGDDYFDLTINNVGENFVFDLTGDIEVKGNLTIADGTFNAAGNTITVSGNWGNSDTFTHGSGTVTFDDAAKTSVISGDTTFYNLTCSTQGKTIQFTEGSTQTIDGVFTIQGSVGNLVTLESTNSGVSWNLTHNGTENVEYAAVQRSNATGNLIDAYTSVDNGNNSANWNFTGRVLTWNSSGTDYGTAANWTPNYVPTSADSAIVPTGATTIPVLDADRSVKDVAIQSGATLDIQGWTLTISNSFENQGILKRYGTASSIENKVTKTDADSGTTYYYNSGTDIQDYGSQDYYNLTLDGVSITLEKALGTANNLEIKPSTGFPLHWRKLWEPPTIWKSKTGQHWIPAVCILPLAETGPTQEPSPTLAVQSISRMQAKSL